MIDFEVGGTFYIAAQNCFSFCLQFSNKMAAHLSVNRHKVQSHELKQKGGGEERRTTLKKATSYYTTSVIFLDKKLLHQQETISTCFHNTYIHMPNQDTCFSLLLKISCQAFQMLVTLHHIFGKQLQCQNLRYISAFTTHGKRSCRISTQQLLRNRIKTPFSV